MTNNFKNENWFVSHWNYDKRVVSESLISKKIKFHDTTLRDGEQQAGFVFRKDEKILIAEKLAELGIDRIEAGMPAVSKEDEHAIKEIVRRNLGPEIYVFCRCVKDDIKRALDCGVKGIIIEIPSSKHIIEKAYGWSVEKATEMSIEATAFAGENNLYTVFFPVDMSRAERDWFFKLINRVANEGHMDALTIVDTMGVLSPHGTKYLVREIKKRINKPLEAHFHNDFNCAATNTIVAVCEGVEVVHATISGIGERAGMTAYEDVAMILQTMYGVDLNIDFKKMYDLSKTMQDFLGIHLPDNRPIVGDGIFNVESGIPVSWMKNCMNGKDTLELFPFHWNFVGHDEPRVVFGKHSGGSSIENYLEKIGKSLSAEQVNSVLQEVKDKAYKKKTVLSDCEVSDIVKKYIV